MNIEILNGGVSWAKDEPIEYDWLKVKVTGDGRDFVIELCITDDSSRGSRVQYIEFRDKENEKIAKKNKFKIEEHRSEILDSWDHYSNKKLRS